MTSPTGRPEGTIAFFRDPLEGLSGLPIPLLLGSAGVLFLALSLPSLWGDSATADEPTHLLSGCRALRLGDFTFNPEHPPLAKILMALPSLAQGVRLPGEKDGYVLLYQCGNDPDRVLRWARVPNLLWGLLTLVLIYRIARELFGPKGAFVSLFLAALCPMLLAHCSLVTIDASVTAMTLLTIEVFRGLYGNLGIVRCFWCGIVLGLALSTKFSAVFLIPVLMWSWLVAYIRRKRLVNAPGTPGIWDEALRVRTLGRVAGAVLLISVTCGALVWGMYGFRFRASPGDAHPFEWTFESSEGSTTKKLVLFARDHRLLPESYLYGYLYMHENSLRRRAYALGQYSEAGWAWYFPFAFLVKTPVGTLILIAAGMYASYRRLRLGTARDAFLLVPLIFYWVLAVNSNLNIGVRHLLPVLPLFLIFAGGVTIPPPRPTGPSWTSIAVLGLLTLSGVEAIANAPHHLAFFNPAARMAWNRHDMLVDSNLDWGQDLARLKRWMDRESIPSVKLSYFGNGSPRHLGLAHEILPGASMYRWYEREWKEAPPLRPGDIVAVSASNYVGALQDKDRDFFLRRFGTSRPLAVIGGSILVFRVAGEGGS